MRRSSSYRRRRFQDAPLTVLQAWVTRFPFVNEEPRALPMGRRRLMLENRVMLEDEDEYWLLTDDPALAYDLSARRLDPWLVWRNLCDYLGRDYRWHALECAAPLPTGACLDLCRVWLALQTSRLVWLDSDARLRARLRLDMREDAPRFWPRGPLVAFFSGLEGVKATPFWETTLTRLATAMAPGSRGAWFHEVFGELPRRIKEAGLPPFPSSYVVHHFRNVHMTRTGAPPRVIR